MKNVNNIMKGYISFYLVLALFLILSIFIFIIMIQVNVAIPAQLNQQVSLFIAGADIRNINSILSAKAENDYNIEVPIIDLIIAASFFDGNKYSNLDYLLYSTNSRFSSKYDIDFGYCTDVECRGNCNAIYTFPTAYGLLVLCSVEFESTFGYGRECGQQ